MRDPRRQEGQLVVHQVCKLRPVEFAKLSHNDRNVRGSEILAKALDEIGESLRIARGQFLRLGVRLSLVPQNAS